MYVKFVFVLVCSVFLLGSKIPNRKPDVVSQRAKISDYYIYDKKSRKWIWKPDYYAAVRKKMAKNRKKYRKLQAKKKPVIKKKRKVEPFIYRDDPVIQYILK